MYFLLTGAEDTTPCVDSSPQEVQRAVASIEAAARTAGEKRPKPASCAEVAAGGFCSYQHADHFCPAACGMCGMPASLKVKKLGHPNKGHHHHPHHHNPHGHNPHGHSPHSHHPHHPHHPEPACSKWPVFQDGAALAASPWGAYFTDIYGTPPPAHKFPLDISTWWVLWTDALVSAGVPLPASSGECAPKNCQLNLYTQNNAYSPPGTQWIWHPPPYAPSNYEPPPGNPWTGENGWIEVLHKKDPFGDE
jgi:hypothetical protein